MKGVMVHTQVDLTGEAKCDIRNLLDTIEDCVLDTGFDVPHCVVLAAACVREYFPKKPGDKFPVTDEEIEAFEKATSEDIGWCDECNRPFGLCECKE